MASENDREVGMTGQCRRARERWERRRPVKKETWTDTLGMLGDYFSGGSDQSHQGFSLDSSSQVQTKRTRG